MSALTKIFIVLQLVCSLVVAVILVVALRNQAPLAKDIQAERTARSAAELALAKERMSTSVQSANVDRLTAEVRNAKKDSEETIRTLRDQVKAKDSEIDVLKNSVAAESAKTGELTSANNSLAKENARLHQEIERIGPENTSLVTKIAEMSRANNELVTQVRFAEQQIRKLQEALTAAQAKGGAGAAAPTEASSVATLTQTTPAQINGKVTTAGTSAGRTLMEIGLGSRDGLKVGTHVVVSRNGSFIADAVVEKVTPEASVAVTTDNVKKGEAVKAGDLVTAGNPQ